VRKAVIALLALVASVALITTAQAGKAKPAEESPVDQPTAKELSTALQEKVKTNGIFRHLNALQQIATDNGDTRTSGTKGYNKSAKYVAGQLEEYGWNVETQKFAFDAFFEDEPTVFEQTAPEAKTYVEDTDFATMEFSGSGDVTQELVAVDLAIPPPAEPGSTSGCEPADFTAANVTGKIALMQRGTCDFGVKVQNAADAGAVGAVIFNEGQEGRTDVIFGTLGGAATIPAVDTSFATGSDLANGVLNGPTGTTVHIKTTTHVENLKTSNVIAETPSGSKKNVVMAGAHLDSVADGPGINDNGSGSATLLELARQISKLGVEPNNKIRFAWWGAEEQGLVGSTEYVSGLKKGKLAKIAAYLNFDMIGSPNFARLIYDGDGSAFGTPGPEGSDKIERTFAKHFKRADLATEETQFDGRSDYLAFTDAGIPAGGLFTGAEEVKTEEQKELYGGKAGVAFDPCYHQACDDIGNVSRRALKQMAPAVADAVARYSVSTDSLGGGKDEKERAASASMDYLGSHLAR
jgi:Zn-dependent M28 family amino/carboxypeptidase